MPPGRGLSSPMRSLASSRSGPRSRVEFSSTPSPAVPRLAGAEDPCVSDQSPAHRVLTSAWPARPLNVPKPEQPLKREAPCPGLREPPSPWVVMRPQIPRSCRQDHPASFPGSRHQTLDFISIPFLREELPGTVLCQRLLSRLRRCSQVWAHRLRSPREAVVLARRGCLCRAVQRRGEPCCPAHVSRGPPGILPTCRRRGKLSTGLGVREHTSGPVPATQTPRIPARRLPVSLGRHGDANASPSPLLGSPCGWRDGRGHRPKQRTGAAGRGPRGGSFLCRVDEVGNRDAGVPVGGWKHRLQRLFWAWPHGRS